MKSNKILNRLFIIILFILVFLVLPFTVIHRAENTPEKREWWERTRIDMDATATPADSMLFKLDQIEFSLPFHLETSDLRSDKRSLTVSNNGGYIDYTSIDLNEDRPLDEVLFFQAKETPPVKDVHPITSIRTRLRQGPPTDTIICSYTADANGLREFRHNDNFHSYNLNVKTLSIRYGEDEPIDMAIPQDVKKTPRPMSFAFLKRGTKVYFIVYGRNVEKTDPVLALGDDFLGRIVKWEET